ncbi:MAG: hypothetical protein AAFQ87_22865 [Bacteroidota bacterium]
MAFTRQELAEHLASHQLMDWVASEPAQLDQHRAEIDTHMQAVLRWITSNGGQATFGRITQNNLDLVGLWNNNNLPNAVYTDVFFDIPHFLPQDNFSPRQAAENTQRLINNLLR